jgi:hypothetical protein
MKIPAIPEVSPADSGDLPEVIPVDGRACKGQVAGKRPWTIRFLSGVVGWLWRWLAGTVLCFNFIFVSYLTSILVVGWLYRWMQGRVLYGWWKRSTVADRLSFEEFCTGLDMPVTSRPRWCLRDGPAKSPASSLSTKPTARRLALWLNLRIGFQGLLCTYALTGWGCLVMLFSWEFGWLNSFNKGYEQAPVGPLTGLAGIFLFITAMFYVPMAQVHQAVTGDARAFFDFRFVWRLIQARPLAYTGLAAVTTLASLPLTVLKTAPVAFDDHFDLWSQASDAEVLRYLRYYFLGCAAFLFLTLLVVRLVASRLYQRAVLRVLARGWVAEADLHPTLNQMLKRLELRPALPEVAPRFAWGAGALGGWMIGAADQVVFLIALAAALVAGPVGFLLVLAVWGAPWLFLWLVGLFRHQDKLIGEFNLRRLAFALLFWIWFAFVAQVYVSEFLNHHPVVGFLNHMLVQFPCFDFVPLGTLTPP